MAYQKTSVGKAEKKDKKYKVKQNKDIEIEIVAPGTEEYDVDLLAFTDLPSTVEDEGQSLTIVWYNNFSIKKKDGAYIDQSYKVKLPGAKALRNDGKKIVIFDGVSNEGKPYVFKGDVDNDDTFELKKGDPAVGAAPP